MALPTTALRRIRADLETIAKLGNASIQVVQDECNASRLTASITGPTGTPYEGGVFNLLLEIPPRYPFQAPTVAFKTPIYHPNIEPTEGYICLDILKDKWSPVQNIHSVLVSIQALLSAPNVDDPLEPTSANQLATAPDAFDRTAREWTRQYAHPHGSNTAVRSAAEEPSLLDNAMTAKFVAMGFAEEHVIRVLRELQYPSEDVSQDEVINRLLSTSV